MSDVQPETQEYEESVSDEQAVQKLDEVEQIAPQAMPLDGKLDEFGEQIGAVASGMKQLQADFDSKIKYDQSKDHIIDTLHKELQDLREDLTFKILRPMANDLVTLHDDIDSYTSSQANDESTRKAVDDMRDFMLDIQGILDRYGFELFENEAEYFDRQVQRAMQAEPTDESELDLRIARRVRKGLRYGERILRPENVVVYRLTKEESQSEQPE